MPTEEADFCDINFDGELNIIDVVLLVSFILENQEPDEYQFIFSDINNDNALNVVDIILLVNIILDEL